MKKNVKNLSLYSLPMITAAVLAIVKVKIDKHKIKIEERKYTELPRENTIINEEIEPVEFKGTVTLQKCI